MLIPLVGFLAACGSSDSKGTDTGTNGLSPGGSSSSGSSSAGSSSAGSAASLACGAGIETVQALTATAVSVYHTEVAGAAVFFFTDKGVYRVPLGDTNPEHAKLLDPSTRGFMLVDSQIGVFQPVAPNQPGSIAWYALDGTPGGTLSLPVAEITTDWHYDADRKQLYGLEPSNPVTLLRVDPANGQSQALAVTPQIIPRSYDRVYATSAGIIVGSAKSARDSQLFRIDPESGTATEIVTGLAEFLLSSADSSSAYLTVNENQPNPGIYRQPLQGGAPTRIAELDGRTLLTFVIATSEGTFGETYRTFDEDYSVFRVGPDAPAAPAKVAEHSCGGSKDLHVYDGSLYLIGDPNDVYTVFRAPLP